MAVNHATGRLCPVREAVHVSPKEAADLAIGGAVLLGLGVINVGLILWEGLRRTGDGWYPSGGHGVRGPGKMARDDERRMTKLGKGRW